MTRLPIARDDGYYLVDKGQVTFVPIVERQFADTVNALSDAFFRGGQDGKNNIIELARQARKGVRS